MTAIDPTSDRATGDGHLTSATVSRSLREMLDSRFDADRPVDEAIRHVSVCGDRVTVHLAVGLSGLDELEALDTAVQARLRSLGAGHIEVVIQRPERQVPSSRGVRDPWAGRVRLASVRHVIAVGAGKGGVGKSTVAINLALALARDGLRAGLLDADIYGPSLPILLGIEDGAARARMTPERYILPLEAHGLPLVSFGFFLGQGSPAIWRGPMVAKAVKQFARGVAWPSLDALVVDLPPGTGDVPLSLAQAVELSGAVVVTQPARVATAEARKAVQMFASLDVPVLGIVENMTGSFGAGAGLTTSTELGVPYLGHVPFDPEIVREGDAGTPTMVSRACSASANAFDRVAQRVAAALGWHRV